MDDKKESSCRRKTAIIQRIRINQDVGEQGDTAMDERNINRRDKLYRGQSPERPK
jgi:hypothetical protein